MNVSLRNSLLVLPLSAALFLPQLAIGEKDASMMTHTVDTACVQRAVDTRETAILSAVTAFGASLQSAYTARKNALHDAWALTDAKQRKDAIKTAWSTFKDARKVAKKKHKEDVRAAWKTFRSSVKPCKAGAEATDAGGEGSDIQP